MIINYDTNDNSTISSFTKTKEYKYYNSTTTTYEYLCQITTNSTGFYLSEKKDDNSTCTSSLPTFKIANRYASNYFYDFNEDLGSFSENNFYNLDYNLNYKLKSIINKRCSPNIIIKKNDRRKPLPVPHDIREKRARETLKRVIGEKNFLNFLKSGFVSVKAKSGLVYQIFPGHGKTCVFDQGKLIDKLCVVLEGDFPPTDSLIMRYLLILNNENQFRNYAIKHPQIIQVYQEPKIDMRSLVEIYKEIKMAKTA